MLSILTMLAQDKRNNVYLHNKTQYFPLSHTIIDIIRFLSECFCKAIDA